MGIYRFKVGGAFEEFGDSSLGGFYVGLSGGTSGSNYSSGSSYSSDNRKHDGIFFNQLSMTMHSIANQYSGSIGHGDSYIDVSVRASIISNTIEFTINGRYNIGSTTMNNGQYAIDTELRYLSNDYVNLKKEIFQDATYALNDLKSEYSDYDGRMKIRIILNDPTRY